MSIHGHWTKPKKCISHNRSGPLQNDQNAKTRTPNMQTKSRRDALQNPRMQQTRKTCEARVLGFGLYSWVLVSVPRAIVLHLRGAFCCILGVLELARPVWRIHLVNSIRASRFLLCRTEAYLTPSHLRPQTAPRIDLTFESASMQHLFWYRLRLEYRGGDGSHS